MVGEQTVNAVLVGTTILAACALAVALYSEWLLKKYGNPRPAGKHGSYSADLKREVVSDSVKL